MAPLIRNYRASFSRGLTFIKKYHLENWTDLCFPEDQRGPGIPMSRHMNVSLMLKLVWWILRD